ncbi:MAG: hypothetical protein JWR90_1550 [Marmoricola sp.]|nr:hypothetical protein [Marmoricola sp.]
MTPAGRAAVVLAVLGWGLGLSLHWTELLYLGATATVLVLFAVLSILVPHRAAAQVRARPAHTTVGSTLHIELSVRGGLVPLVHPVVRLLGDVGARTVRLPLVLPGRTREEVYEEPAGLRGIFALGPVEHVQADVLGFARRTRTWGASSALWVRPRVLVPREFSLGGVFDLEGLPSDQMSMSDLAFHALREYVPGDDLRNVHWRSSAKADKLLVRQYLESRSLHAAFVVDDDPSAYATAEEFETAVSVAASLALRALADGFEVDVACGTRVVSPVTAELLLDECCHYSVASARSAGTDVANRARELSRRGSAVGVGVVVSGSTCDLERLLEASTAFGGDAQRITVRVDPASRGGVRRTHGVHVLEIAELEQLPRLAAWVSA